MKAKHPLLQTHLKEGTVKLERLSSILSETPTVVYTGYRSDGAITRIGYEGEEDQAEACLQRLPSPLNW